MPVDENLAKVQRELFIRSMVGESFTQSQLRELLSLCRDVTFLRGETVYRRGDASDTVYFVSDGNVELSDSEMVPWVFSGQSVIGILDAIIDRPRSRNAIALTDVNAVALRTDDYFDFLEDNSSVTQTILVRNARDLFERFLASDNREQLLSPSDAEPLKQHENPLSLVERLLIVGKIRPFLTAPAQALVSLAEYCKEWQGRAGTVLFEEGDPSQMFWMIARGRVTIERKHPHMRVQRGPGELIENYAAFGYATRQYTATAETDVTMLRIEKEDLLDRMEEYFDLMRSVLSFLALQREEILDAAVSGGA